MLLNLINILIGVFLLLMILLSNIMGSNEFFGGLNVFDDDTNEINPFDALPETSGLINIDDNLLNLDIINFKKNYKFHFIDLQNFMGSIDFLTFLNTKNENYAINNFFDTFIFLNYTKLKNKIRDILRITINNKQEALNLFKNDLQNLIIDITNYNITEITIHDINMKIKQQILLELLDKYLKNIIQNGNRISVIRNVTEMDSIDVYTFLENIIVDTSPKPKYDNFEYVANYCYAIKCIIDKIHSHTSPNSRNIFYFSFKPDTLEKTNNSLNQKILNTFMDYIKSIVLIKDNECVIFEYINTKDNLNNTPYNNYIKLKSIDDYILMYRILERIKIIFKDYNYNDLKNKIYLFSKDNKILNDLVTILNIKHNNLNEDETYGLNTECYLSLGIIKKENSNFKSHIFYNKYKYKNIFHSIKSFMDIHQINTDKLKDEILNLQYMAEDLNLQYVDEMDLD